MTVIDQAGVESRAIEGQRYVTDRIDRGQTGLNAAIPPASNELDRMTDVALTTDERTDERVVVDHVDAAAGQLGVRKRRVFEAAMSGLLGVAVIALKLALH